MAWWAAPLAVVHLEGKYTKSTRQQTVKNNQYKKIIFVGHDGLPLAHLFCLFCCVHFDSCKNCLKIMIMINEILCTVLFV